MFSAHFPLLNPIGFCRRHFRPGVSGHDNHLQSRHRVLPHEWLASSATASLLPAKPCEVSYLGGNDTNRHLDPKILISHLLSVVPFPLGQSVGISLKSISQCRCSAQCPVEFIWTSEEPKYLCFFTVFIQRTFQSMRQKKKKMALLYPACHRLVFGIVLRKTSTTCETQTSFPVVFFHVKCS